MLVGTAIVDNEELAKHINTYEDYVEYCDSLVPLIFRHRQDICSNQRYYCTLLLRKNKNVSWDIKKDLIDKVMCDNKAVGFTNSIIDVAMLESYMDNKRMNKYDRRFNK